MSFESAMPDPWLLDEDMEVRLESTQLAGGYVEGRLIALFRWKTRLGGRVASVPMFATRAPDLPQQAISGTGRSFASFRRFWAVAPRWNSSRAPFGPRNRRRLRPKMRFKCANSISTFLRSLHDIA